MLNTLGVLLNNKCNLSCDYCYIKHGNQELSYEIFCKAITRFFTDCQPQFQPNIIPTIFF